MLLSIRVALIACASLAVFASARADDTQTLTLASTTSTENSGLLGYLLPKFTEQTGIDVRVVAVGTGAALELGRNGDADVLLVHDTESEEAFVEAGHGVERVDVMYNDFVLVGPKDDPAKIVDKGGAQITVSLRRIYYTRVPFVSRGDDSGTHKAERRMWRRSGKNPVAGRDAWYRETGSGMGAALNTANAMGAYTISDRGTWISFRNRGDMKIVIEGDPPLFNPYGVILVNPEKHPHVKAEAGQALIDWLVSDAGQKAIGEFQVEGEVLFHPNAKPAGEEAGAPTPPPPAPKPSGEAG